MNPLTARLISIVRERGPITVAEFMEVALYHPEHGYYSSRGRRSGRDGDFFTSVDAGPLFGHLVARQIDEMWTVLRDRGAASFHLVEAGAGNGRLARDVLDALAESPELYRALRLTLVELSAAARARHEEVLGPHAAAIPFESTVTLPHSVTGAIVANELLDAMPVHVIEMSADGLSEVHVREQHGSLREVVLPLTDQRVRRLLENTGFDARGIDGESRFRAEAGVAAVDWVEAAARALDRGFLLLFDYGREAPELYSAVCPAGTLMAYRNHRADETGWLEDPGTRDLGSDVNLTAIRNTASDAGLQPLGIVDQTYFLTSLGLAGLLNAGQDVRSIRERMAARTLIQPGGLGSTIKAMAFGKAVGKPALRGFAAGRST